MDAPHCAHSDGGGECLLITEPYVWTERPMTISAPTSRAAEPRIANKVSAKTAMRRCAGPKNDDSMSKSEGGSEGSSDIAGMRIQIEAAFQPAVRRAGKT